MLLLATEAVAAVALHRLGGRPPFDLPLDRLDPWLHADPVDALAAGARLAALAFAWWLAVTTAAYALARVAHVPTAVRTLHVVTPAAVRLIVDRALVASLLAGALHVPALPALRTSTAAVAAEPAPASVEVRTGRSPTAVAPEAGIATTTAPTAPPATGPRPAPAPSPSAAPSTTPAAATPSPPAPAAGPEHEQVALPDARVRSVVVRPGDNLWGLAAEALAAATGRPRATLGDAEIAPYWRTVCDANRASLRSGDVNLIYPGERVVLPPVA